MLTRGQLARVGLILAAALLILAGGLFAAGTVREDAVLDGRYVAALDVAAHALDAQRAAVQVSRQLMRVTTRSAESSVRGSQFAAELQGLIDGLSELGVHLATLRAADSSDSSGSELARAESAAAALLARARETQRHAAAGDLAGARKRLNGGADREFEQINGALGGLLAAKRARIDEAAASRVQRDGRIARISVLVAGTIALALGLLLTLLAWRSLSANALLMVQLAQLAREDGLTGVANRRTLDERLPQEMARALRQKYPLSVVMIDLDYFKRFNDRRGHAAGDALLRNAAQAWLRQLRPTDLLARYGGEEFTLVLPACGESQAEHMVERLQPLVPERQTFSAGIATWNGQDSAHELLAAADKALLQAKRGGRNRMVISGREPQISLPLKLVS